MPENRQTERTIALYRTLLRFWPKRLGRFRIIHALSKLLYLRFQQLGSVSSLEEALALERSAFELLPCEGPSRAVSLNTIGDFLRARFKRSNAISDLEDALSMHRRALELRQLGHPHRATSLTNVGHCLFSRFKHRGTPSDLDEALALCRDALQLHPQGDPHRASSLINVARCLHSRFKQFGRLSDLNEALALHRDALQLRPHGDPSRASSLVSLASSLYYRFKQLGKIEDLEEALALHRDALQLFPERNPDRAISLNNLASCLCSRFEQLRIQSDLDEALALLDEALGLLPQGHPDRANSLINLANCHLSRFKHLGVLPDFDEALACHRDALQLCPQGHPHRPLFLGRLANCLHTRFKSTSDNDMGALEEIFRLYSQFSDVSHAFSPFALNYATRWILTAESYGHRTTVLAYQTFLRLCVHHLATVPCLPQQLTPLKQLVGSTPVDAFSACLRHGNLASAVELLEHGRGIFWTQLIRLRTPLLDEVMASGDVGRQLGIKFKETAAKLRNLLESPSNIESQHDRACHFGIRMQNLITQIRELPDCSRFLESPLFSELQSAATNGPVIIVNASEYTCDALIILFDREPIRVPLSITKSRVSELSSELRSLTSQAKFIDVTRDLIVLLRDLWDSVVRPMAKVLLKFCPCQSRVWWCPSAEFSLLPLHAAGSYRPNQRNFSDLYTSSYTPTLAALIRARQRMSPEPRMQGNRFLLVGQAQAPGQDQLVSVDSELSSLSDRIRSVSTLTCIQNQDANIAKVSDELNKHEFVHLACHGIPDPKQPFESGFALGNGLLKIENIMQYDLRNAEFAYLSACHTTVGDEESPDEVIHLAAAMHFAGFRSVIGTMWAVDDAYTEEITSKFYDYMVDESGRLDHTRAALALHRTMQSIRDIPFDQRILYIHIGA